jgi:hypothetical protein
MKDRKDGNPMIITSGDLQKVVIRYKQSMLVEWVCVLAIEIWSVLGVIEREA